MVLCAMIGENEKEAVFIKDMEDNQILKKKSQTEYYKNTGIKLLVIHEICELAQKYDIKKVTLFGSRARGDFKRTSDIDLACTGGNYVGFALDVDDLTSTLLQYDIVNLDGAVQKELADSIRKEGITIYEKV